MRAGTSAQIRAANHRVHGAPHHWRACGSGACSPSRSATRAGQPTGSTPPHLSPGRHRGRWQTQRTLAQRWLCGELDDQVAVPVRFVCDVLGIDGDAIAAAVRRSAAPRVP